MKISTRQAEVQEKAREHGLTLTKTDIAKLPWTLSHHEETVAQAKTLNDISDKIDEFEANAFKVVKYATGTLYKGILETHETIDVARVCLASYKLEEMQDKDDHAILFEILGNGSQHPIANFRPEPEPVEPDVPVETAPSQVVQHKVKYVEVYERYSPKNKDLLSFSTSTLKAEVLETLGVSNAAQAAKWAKAQGMNGIDLCYKAHWAALAEKAREYTEGLSEEEVEGAA